MPRKESFDLKKIEVIAERKINGCGKIIPDTWLVKIMYEGRKVAERKEVKGDVWRYLLDWLEEEEC